MDDRNLAALPAAIAPHGSGSPHPRWSLVGWFARQRERRKLRNLSDASLKDCGLTRAQIEAEIRRLRW